MNPVLKYTLGRVGIFVICALLAFLLLPRGMNPMLKLMIAFLLSALVSFAALKRTRLEVDAHLAERAQRRQHERARLRAALAGESPSGDSQQGDSPIGDTPPGESKDTEPGDTGPEDTRAEAAEKQQIPTNAPSARERRVRSERPDAD
jgi:hypothetical protein